MAARTWKNTDTVKTSIQPGPYAAESVRLWKTEARNYGFRLANKEFNTYTGDCTLTFERIK